MSETLGLETLVPETSTFISAAADTDHDKSEELMTTLEIVDEIIVYPD